MLAKPEEREMGMEKQNKAVAGMGVVMSTLGQVVELWIYRKAATYEWWD